MIQPPIPNTQRPISGKPKPPGTSQQRQSGQQPKFGMSAKGLMDCIDFKEVASPHVSQIKIIYTCCILWRLLAANQRRKASPTKSWNEVRESALRDSMGFLFWFFATPSIQRLFLRGFAPKDIQQNLLHEKPQTAKGGGPLNFIKKLNPLTKWDIPSSEQVKDQMEQALASLKAKNIAESDAAYKTTKAYYERLTKYRNLATGAGLITTMLLLGIGINLFNFYMTRRNVERRKAELKKQQQATPHQSTSPFQRLNPVSSHPFRSFAASPTLSANAQPGMPQHPYYSPLYNPAFSNGFNPQGH